MALTITLSTAIDAERTEVTLTDSTTFGTGGNPARADVGVFLGVAKVDYEGEETDLTVTSDDDDPSTDSEWTFSYENGDGYYKERYIAVPDYDAGTTYAQYDAAMDTTTKTVYRSKSAGNVGNSLSNTTYWELIDDVPSLCDNKDTSTESANCNSLIIERVFTANGQYAYGNLIAENCQCSDCDNEELLNQYLVFSILLNGAIAADERTQPLSGELICRRIQSLYIDNNN